MFEWGCTHATALVWGSGTTLWSLFSLATIMWVPGIWTQVAGLAGQVPYVLGRLTSPTVFVFYWSLLDISRLHVWLVSAVFCLWNSIIVVFTSCISRHVDLVWGWEHRFIPKIDGRRSEVHWWELRPQKIQEHLGIQPWTAHFFMQPETEITCCGQYNPLSFLIRLQIQQSHHSLEKLDSQGVSLPSLDPGNQ